MADIKKFISRIKEGVGIIQPKNYLNPNLDTSVVTMNKVKERNQKIQNVQRELSKAQAEYNFWKKQEGNEVVTRSKNPPNVYKAEQNLKKVKEANPSINVGQFQRSIIKKMVPLPKKELKPLQKINKK